MAGQYQDVPGVRLPYHVDGTLIKIVSTDSNSVVNGTWTGFSGNDAAALNDGNPNNVWTPPNYGWYMIAFAFPYLVQWVGHNIVYRSDQTGYGFMMNLFYSKDTTDGTDGTWTSTAHNSTVNNSSPVAMRSFSSVNITDVKGLRVAYKRDTNYTMYFNDIMFYGFWVPTTLAAWHPTQDQQISGAHLDFGNILLGTTPAAKQFRIKNGNTSTANNVVVSVPVGTPYVVSNLKFSLDGSTYTSSVNITQIASGGISPPIYVKRTVLAGETPNTAASVPIVFTASSWT